MLQGLSSFLPEAQLSLYDNLEFLIRILLSLVFGLLIGLERTKRLKDAGVRTHCIIAVTAATFMIISKYAFLDIEALIGGKLGDGARIAAQVVSGISFIGAGVIFRDRNSSIKGLTTAAGMWATSAVGLAIGAGLYWLGAIEAIAVIIGQTVLHKFPVGGDALSAQEIGVRMEDDPNLLQLVEALVKQHGGTVEQSRITREEGIITLKLSVRLVQYITYEEALELMQQNKGILEINV